MSKLREELVERHSRILATEPGNVATVLTDRQVNELTDGILDIIINALPESWITGPMYKPEMVADKDGSTAYFTALGHGKCLHKIKRLLIEAKEEKVYNETSHE